MAIDRPVIGKTASVVTTAGGLSGANTPTSSGASSSLAQASACAALEGSIAFSEELHPQISGSEIDFEGFSPCPRYPFNVASVNIVQAVLDRFVLPETAESHGAWRPIILEVLEALAEQIQDPSYTSA